MEHTYMKSAYEKLYGRLQGEETPSRAYLGLKTTDVEEDEPKAERLNEVTAATDQQEDFLTTSVDSEGRLKIKKGSRDTSMPKGSEELRSRL
eukprot:8562515-Karenia_brevis.AAC.1